jgi:hypothetical protein
MKTLARAAACVLATGALTMAMVGTSSAATASLTLTYTCNFPLLLPQDVPTTVTSTDVPDSAAVGVPTAASTNTVTSTVPLDAADTLRNLLAAKTVEGTITSKVTVTNGAAKQTLTSVAVIPSTPVPSSGTFQVTAAGTLPAITLANAGTATISLGDSETKLTPRDAAGDVTWIGTITSTCKVKAGQSTALHSFPVA